jgi:hypothetical protein
MAPALVASTVIAKPYYVTAKEGVGRLIAPASSPDVAAATGLRPVDPGKHESG